MDGRRRGARRGVGGEGGRSGSTRRRIPAARPAGDAAGEGRSPPVPAADTKGPRRTRGALALIDSFPKGFEPRRVQSDIIRQIEEAIESGYRNILLCAPTGIGKSHIAATVAAARGSSFTVTAQKILQDQYTGDFGWMKPMKGMSNFPCLDLYDSKKIDYATAASDPSVSCARGNCSREVRRGGVTRTVWCKYKPRVDDYEDGEPEAPPPGADRACYYYDQKYRALNAGHSVFNYPSYFQTRKYSKGIQDYLERSLLVADETHEIEDQIIDFVGYELHAPMLRDAGLDFSGFEITGMEGIEAAVEVTAEAYNGMVRRMEEEAERANAGRAEPGENPLIAAYKSRRDRLDTILREIRRDPSNMVYQVKREGGWSDSADDGDIVAVSIKPLDISSYIKEYFDYPLQLFMSATIDRTMFCRTMGFGEDECRFVEVPRSPFSPESRTVTFHDVRRLSYRSSREDYAAVYAKARQIAAMYEDQKGLILTTTRRHCDDVAGAIGDRVRVAYERDGMGRDAVLKRHAEDGGPSVLASPSLWYGVDLKGDLSRFQIIVKAPYPSMGDKRTRAKADRDPLWYQYTALVKLLQGFGRSVRGEDDYAETHVLDEGAKALLHKMRRFVPRAYHDVLGWEDGGGG